MENLKSINNPQEEKQKVYNNQKYPKQLNIKGKYKHNIPHKIRWVELPAL